MEKSEHKGEEGPMGKTPAASLQDLPAIEAAEAMPSAMGKAAEYLRGMKFKHRAVGGVDEDDVLEHLDAVTRIYNEGLLSERAALRANHEERAREFEQRRAALSEREAELAKRADELEADYRAKADQLLGSLNQMDELREAIEAQASQKAEEELRRARLEAAEIESAARSEAARILDTAKSEAYEKRRLAEESASRFALERREHEEAIQRLKLEIEAMCSGAQKALDRTKALVAGAEGKESPS